LSEQTRCHCTLLNHWTY